MDTIVNYAFIDCHCIPVNNGFDRVLNISIVDVTICADSRKSHVLPVLIDLFICTSTRHILFTWALINCEKQPLSFKIMHTTLNCKLRRIQTSQFFFYWLQIWISLQQAITQSKFELFCKNLFAIQVTCYRKRLDSAIAFVNIIISTVLYQSNC